MLQFKTPDGRTWEVEQKGESTLLNGKKVVGDWATLSAGEFHVIRENKTFSVQTLSIDHQEKSVRLKVNHHEITLTGKSKMDLLLAELGMDKLKSAAINELKAPMPGMILNIHVAAGQQIRKGDKLLVLEAMKMENVIKAPADATVKAIHAKAGENVEKNQLLISFA